jgi:hypothetical protein
MRGVSRSIALGSLVLATALCGAGGWLLLDALVRCSGSLSCAMWLGSPLLELRAPAPGVVRGSVPIVVRFPDRGRVSLPTFRCLLDGVDVTDRLTARADGVRGAIYPVRSGPVTLRVSIFGEGSAFGSGRFVEHSVELTVVVDTEAVLLDRA